MNTNIRAKTISRTLLAVLCAGGLAFASCTTQESNSSTGTKTATTTGTGSGTGTGTGAGTGTGTGVVTTTGTGTGTGTGTSAAETGVLCPLPAKAPITAFTYAPGDAAAPDTTTVNFGDSTTLQGSEFVYPTTGSYLVTSDVTQGNWHITGTIGDYSGFGLVFFNCTRVDASAYKGISFKISGSVALGNVVTMGVGTVKNAIASSWLNSHGGDGTVKPGSCVPTSGTNQYNQSSCADATKDIPVTATPTVVNVAWADFAGGKPEAGVTASDILAVYWRLPTPAGAGTAAPTPYAVDIVVDDLSFIP